MRKITRGDGIEEIITEHYPESGCLPMPSSQTVPFCCPVCGGRGFVSYGFYLHGETSIFETLDQCRSCAGTGLVWR